MSVLGIRRLRIAMASACPDKTEFRLAHARSSPSSPQTTRPHDPSRQPATPHETAPDRRDRRAMPNFPATDKSTLPPDQDASNNKRW